MMPATREERHARKKQKIAETHKEAKAGLKTNEKRLSKAVAELENLHLLHKLLHGFQMKLTDLPDHSPLVFGAENPLTGGVFKKLFPRGTTKTTAQARLTPYMEQLSAKKTALCDEIEKLEQITEVHSEQLEIAGQLKELHHAKIKAEKLKIRMAEKKRAQAEKKREQKEKERELKARKISKPRKKKRSGKK